MTLGIVFGKRVWIGLGVSVGVMSLLVSLLAALVTQGVVSQTQCGVWLSVFYGIAAFVGGRLAMGGVPLRACVTAALFYGMVWLLALWGEGEVRFAPLGWYATAAVVLGGIAAVFTRSGRGRRRRGYRGKRYNAGKIKR